MIAVTVWCFSRQAARAAEPTRPSVDFQNIKFEETRGEEKEGEIPAAPITRTRISGGLEWERRGAAQKWKCFFQSR